MTRRDDAIAEQERMVYAKARLNVQIEREDRWLENVVLHAAILREFPEADRAALADELRKELRPPRALSQQCDKTPAGPVDWANVRLKPMPWSDERAARWRAEFIADRARERHG